MIYQNDYLHFLQDLLGGATTQLLTRCWIVPRLDTSPYFLYPFQTTLEIYVSV
jgi:hypothetical protein